MPSPVAAWGAAETRDAFEALFRDHASDLGGFFWNRTRNVDSRDELLQITAEKAYRAFERTRRRGNFNGKAWLWQIARNAVIDYNRARRRGPAIVPIQFLDDDYEPAAEYDPEEWDTVVDVEALLARLPARHRRVLVERFWKDQSMESLAQRWGCSVDAVKQRQRRAVRAAREVVLVR